MYYNPVNNKIFFFFTTNSFHALGMDFRANFISKEMRLKWENDPHVTRLASNNLAEWNG